MLEFAEKSVEVGVFALIILGVCAILLILAGLKATFALEKLKKEHEKTRSERTDFLYFIREFVTQEEIDAGLTKIAGLIPDRIKSSRKYIGMSESHMSDDQTVEQFKQECNQATDLIDSTVKYFEKIQRIASSLNFKVHSYQYYLTETEKDKVVNS